MEGSGENNKGKASKKNGWSAINNRSKNKGSEADPKMKGKAKKKLKALAFSEVSSPQTNIFPFFPFSQNLFTHFHQFYPPLQFPIYTNVSEYAPNTFAISPGDNEYFYIYRATSRPFVKFTVSGEPLIFPPEFGNFEFKIKFESKTNDGHTFPPDLDIFRIIAWRCNNPLFPDLTHRIENVFQQSNPNPQIFILLNTQSSHHKVSSIMEKIKFSACLVIPPHELKGGAWIFFNRTEVFLKKMGSDYLSCCFRGIRIDDLIAQPSILNTEIGSSQKTNQEDSFDSDPEEIYEEDDFVD